MEASVEPATIRRQVCTCILHTIQVQFLTGDGFGSYASNLSVV